MEQSTVTLAYWAPVYVTVDTSRGEVVSMRLAASGMRVGPRVSGQPVDGTLRDAARIFAEARVEQRLPGIEVA